MTSPLYLGLDCSTQSMTAVLLDPAEQGVVGRDSLRYDDELAEYGTVDGQLVDDDPAIGQVPPLLWVEALQRLLERQDRALLERVVGVAVSGQQHGTVYLRAGVGDALADADWQQPLAAQVRPWLARDVAPIWTDSSTGSETEAMRRCFGGATAAAQATGSDVYERFSGPQIRRFATSNPEGWNDTAHVALVSSFLTSLLAGQVAPIDHGDGSGMALMDIHRRQWHAQALQATAPGLAQRLPRLVAADRIVGRTPKGLAQLGLRAAVAAGTGDNPSTATGLGLVRPGRWAISLGTSDTLFAILSELAIDPQGQGHVFLAPSGHPMPLLCFRNGALARERVRLSRGQHQSALDWRQFDDAVASTPPGNHGRLLVPWYEPEITPRVLEAAPVFVDLDPADGPGTCRAVLEGQALALRLHSEWLGERPATLVATGGAARNDAFLQILADVFQTPLLAASDTDAAALGAALRAWHAERNHTEDATSEPLTWHQVLEAVPAPQRRFQPDPQLASLYTGLLERYRRVVERALES